ncbi:spermatogenesis-associated protein 9 isoform X1 [Muntiacus reevesi]|uniref:spermatogenesis-associated protein 9 isoform X1 n=1 Tax=Muntiacus reevesi TaxID=9886 RepID=UPI003306A6CE
MDLIDEFKDEFPTILRLSQSNQKREPMQKPSKIRMAIALAKINRGTLIQGLNSISRSSKSVAKLLQPQLACRLLELRAISHRLLKEVNAPRQPLYNIQVRKGSLFEIISFPAKTALTSIMCASYAALIYLRNKLKSKSTLLIVATGSSGKNASVIGPTDQGHGFCLLEASLVAQTVKNLPAMWESLAQSLGREDPLEEGIVAHSRIRAWRTPTDRGGWWTIVHGLTNSRT